ncbi:gamma-glutamyl-gamma-aminobutyrate hydrolase family protein [Shimia sp.]|uniref:glutamine amidotransferase-related protein n=1 Tax=Shimia sp. TaxID=1954381 RepID=UPI003296C423
MTTISILEGNPPVLLQQGKSAALPFVTCLMALDASASLQMVCPYAVDVTDEMIDWADGVVFSGAGTVWSAAASEAAPQRAAMQRGFGKGVPVWGSCNGMQLASVVLGGDLGVSANGDECGVARDIALTQAGVAHPMMTGKAPVFASPCSHRDEVQTLPGGAILIAGNDHSPVQAMVYEKDGVDFWGVQYHPECSAPDIAGWMRGRGPDFAQLADNLEQAEADPAAAARIGATPQELAFSQRTQELSNWLSHVKARA